MLGVNFIIRIVEIIDPQFLLLQKFLENKATFNFRFCLALYSKIQGLIIKLSISAVVLNQFFQILLVVYIVLEWDEFVYMVLFKKE